MGPRPVELCRPSGRRTIRRPRANARQSGIEGGVRVADASAAMSSASVADGTLVAVAYAAPSSGNAGGGEEHALSEVSAMAARPALYAADLPAHLAVGDGRSGLVALREFVKRWACFPQQRPMMIAQAPRRHRWHDRLTSRRHDLVRISAVVHALCDRDGLAVPGWVYKHRSRRPIGLAPSLDPAAEWARVAGRRSHGMRIPRCVVRSGHDREHHRARLQGLTPRGRGLRGIRATPASTVSS